MKPKGLSTYGPQGLHVVFDPKDCDTPCMVYLKGQSATFQCVLDTGEIEGEYLTKEQVHFLNGLARAADEFYDAYTRNR